VEGTDVSNDQLPKTANLSMDTHALLTRIGNRWRATNTISMIPVSHDRLIAAGLALLDAAIPWDALDAETDVWGDLSRVVALLPPRAPKAVG
jgi:hypothetical protein